MKIAVVGAGIAGRMLAWRLLKLSEEIGEQFDLTIFDKGNRQEQTACSFAAAGILSPLAELEMAEKTIFEMGTRSLELYPKWLKEFPEQLFFQQEGSLVAAHGQDRVELEHFYNLISRKLNGDTGLVQKVSLAVKENDLAQLGEGLFLPTEGQLDPIELMNALAAELNGIDWIENTKVQELAKGYVKTKKEEHYFDWVFDCRGLGAREGAKEILPLRAVRGELLWLEAPDVNIERIVRLMHPRYKIYIVPRPDNIYLVGATEIESEDYSPLSVRSSLELLSAAYSVNKGFGEARIIKSIVNCRPALPDNLPMVKVEQGLGVVNGLYRHGILLAPALVEKTITEFLKIMNQDSETSYAVNA